MRGQVSVRSTVAHYAPAFCAAALLHAALLTVATGPFWSSPQHPPPADRRDTIVVFRVPPEDSRFPGLNAVDRTADEWLRLAADVRGVRNDFRFDIAKIAARAQVLFPFVTPGIALEHFTFPPMRGTERLGFARELAIDDAQLQRLVDRSWSRRHRWESFQSFVKMTRTYSGNSGRLPDLLQRYCDQNSLQPYADAETRDPRLWVQLGIAADHVDFIGFIRRYAAEHPGTRMTTALLFLLDNVAQGSRDALAPLLDVQPAADLAWTRDADARAYRLAVELKRYYARELARRGLTSAEAIALHYEAVRLAILDEILRTTPRGYRAGDALFLKGTIYWRQKRVRDALQSWRSIAVDANDSHVHAYSPILLLLQKHAAERTGGHAGPHLALSQEINQVLKNAQGRWFSQSYDRLQRFGFRVDTY